MVQHHIISWHHHCKSCCWPALLDRWCNQCHWCASEKDKGDLEQEIVIISQLHIINVQGVCDLDRLAVRRDTTDICSICQEKCESILIEMEMMQKMGTPVPYGGFPLTNLKFKMWLHLKMLIDTDPPCQLQWSGSQHFCFSNTTTSARRFTPCLPFDWAFYSASYRL